MEKKLEFRPLPDIVGPSGLVMRAQVRKALPDPYGLIAKDVGLNALDVIALNVGDAITLHKHKEDEAEIWVVFKENKNCEVLFCHAGEAHELTNTGAETWLIIGIKTENKLSVTF